MKANVFWCGKVHTIDFDTSKEGIATLGKEIESISKIPAEHQMILYQGMAMQVSRAPFDKYNTDTVNFVVYDRRITNESLPSHRIEKNSLVYLNVLNGEDSEDNNLAEDVKMLEYEDSHPITYTNEGISPNTLLESKCTAAIFYHPIKQSYCKFEDKIICKWCAQNCRHTKGLQISHVNPGAFRCQCSEINHPECCSKTKILTQEPPRTPTRFFSELLKESENYNQFFQKRSKERAFACMSTMNFVRNSHDEESEACALSLIPEDITEKYPLSKLDRDSRGYSELDEKVYAVLQWFSKEYFCFLDNPKCPKCGSEMYTEGPIVDHNFSGSSGYIFKCPSCISISSTFIARDFTPAGLIDSQSGYLDEAICFFMLFLESLMIEVRVVVTDTWYKWIEFYSETQGRWIHCDPVMGLFDSPLSYELTWGPFFDECIALSTEYEYVDVSRRYTTDYNELMKRRGQCRTKERFRLIQNQIFQFINLSKGNELKIDVFHRIFERQKDEIRQLVSGKYAYGEVVDKTLNRYMRVPGNNVLIFEEWVKSQKTEDPVLSFPDSKNATKRIMKVGTAIVPQNNQFIILTPNVGNCVGAVWTQIDADKVLKHGFLTEFTFIIESPGADGFAFVIQGLGPNVVGDGGCQIGYGGLHHSLAVEFDNYLSRDECNDPNPSHVGINTMYESPNTANHGVAGIAATEGPINLLDGSHKVAIAFEGKRIIVWMDSELILSTEECELERILKGRDGCWVGFTAATGGLSQLHAITKWEVKYLC